MALPEGAWCTHNDAGEVQLRIPAVQHDLQIDFTLLGDVELEPFSIAVPLSAARMAVSSRS